MENEVACKVRNREKTMSLFSLVSLAGCGVFKGVKSMHIHIYIYIFIYTYIYILLYMCVCVLPNITRKPLRLKPSLRRR